MIQEVDSKGIFFFSFKLHVWKEVNQTPSFLAVYHLYKLLSYFILDFPGDLDGKASAYNAGDPGSIPGSGRSLGEGNGNPLQYFCLENPMDGGTW